MERPVHTGHTSFDSYQLLKKLNSLILLTREILTLLRLVRFVCVSMILTHYLYYIAAFRSVIYERVAKAMKLMMVLKMETEGQQLKTSDKLQGTG